MVRKKQQPGSPFAMYRHFAAVTVVLTAAMAVFIDGESRSAVAGEIEARERQAALAKANEEKFGKPKLVKKASLGGGSFGPDAGSFGEPMDDPGTTGSGYVPEVAGSPGNYMPAAYNRYGLSAEQWDALSEAQRAKLREKARAEEAAARSSERRSQIERLSAASAQRAGAATTD